MGTPYTRFHLLKKRNIFAFGLEQADHIEPLSENRFLAHAVWAAFWALMPMISPFTSN
jgi:hypothetical protein